MPIGNNCLGGMWACGGTCFCVWSTYGCTCTHAYPLEVRGQYMCRSSFCLRQRLSLPWNFTKQVRLTDQKAARIHLSSPPSHNNVSPFLAFCMVLGDPNSGPNACKTNALPNEPSVQPLKVTCNSPIKFSFFV